MTATQSTPLAPSAFLAASSRLGESVLRVVAAPMGISVVDDSNARRAILDSTVRNAMQDLVDPAMALWDLATADLVVASEAEAVDRLAAQPELPAVVVDGPSGVVAVERIVPPVTTAVVMAGGFGTRLRPLTDDTPKPMLDVGGEPLLVRTLRLLQHHGVRKVFVSVHYLADKIEAAIGDGSTFGLDVEYLHESEPLGTGAALVLLQQVAGPFFLLNGDILTNVRLSAMGRDHQLSGHLVSVGTTLYSAPLPYGVVHHSGGRIEAIEEKPVFRYPVNAGVYCFDPACVDLVPAGQPLPMVDFLNDHSAAGRVGRFSIVEYWNDVGSHADYQRAQRDAGQL